jgi:hypothetical protein
MIGNWFEALSLLINISFNHSSVDEEDLRILSSICPQFHVTSLETLVLLSVTVKSP